MRDEIALNRVPDEHCCNSKDKVSSFIIHPSSFPSSFVVAVAACLDGALGALQVTFMLQ